MKKNLLIIGAGGVSNVVAHKCSQYNNILGHICIASRTQNKADAIINSIHRKDNLRNKNYKLYSRQINAMNVSATSKLIKTTNSAIVLNVGSAFINMSVLQACLATGAAYVDTAIHEEPDKICENPPWYANYEWKYLEDCKQRGLTAILGAGFDPGVVNAYCAYALKHYFDKINNIDIMDVNAGQHDKYFATNFDPEINFREFTGKAWTWINRQWVAMPVHTKKQNYQFPVVGKQTVYLSGHDELHSLAKNIPANNIRFWMGFSEHYLNCFNVLKNLGLLSEQPVTTAEGLKVIPLKVVKACLPNPASLASNYTGKTCIGTLINGKKNNKVREIFFYNICDHSACYKELEAQAISYTAGVPVATTAILIASGVWDVKRMVNIEELDPDPFIILLKKLGLATKIQENNTAS